MTASFPEIRSAALAQLPTDTGIDGEVVVWERDRLAFERLQQRLARRGAAAAQAAREWPAHFVAFDLLHRGNDLTGWPYARRRAALEELFAERGLTAPFTLCPSTTDPALAREWLSWAAAGVEGLCFKRLEESYRGGVRSWRKYKNAMNCTADRGRSRCEGGPGALCRLRTDEPVADVRRTRRTAVPWLLQSAPGGSVRAVRQAREGSGTTSGRTDLPSVQGEGAGFAQGVRQLPPDDDSHPAPARRHLPVPDVRPQEAADVLPLWPPAAGERADRRRARLRDLLREPCAPVRRLRAGGAHQGAGERRGPRHLLPLLRAAGEALHRMRADPSRPAHRPRQWTVPLRWVCPTRGPQAAAARVRTVRPGAEGGRVLAGRARLPLVLPDCSDAAGIVHDVRPAGGATPHACTVPALTSPPATFPA
ncbi:hypothetical protein M4D73_20090 [Streptomyces pseudogriseolus]|uniref:ATP-dependent DNA ligase n=1 Tax=Streptomyces pseudogriseolus TaxID=36817 RepID=UPI00348CB147|nr:hypothetical protein [Streptomyces pseudogriseolus]